MELVGLAFAFVALTWVVLEFAVSRQAAITIKDLAKRVDDIETHVAEILAKPLRPSDPRLDELSRDFNTLKSALALKQSFGK